MTVVYRIIDWDKHYENAGSRKIDNCSWCPVPNKQDGLGYSLLVQEPKGTALYGAFVAIVLVCSKQSLPRNGWLTDNGKPDGRALTSNDLHLKTKLPEKTIKEMLERTSKPDIGWIEAISPSVDSAVVAECQPSGSEVVTRSIESTEQKAQKEEEGPNPSASAPLPLAERLSEFVSTILQDREIVEAWKNAYPGVDIEAELPKWETHWLSNPEKAPKSRFKRSFNNWLKIAARINGSSARKPFETDLQRYEREHG